jgi:hypothetical protein
MASLTLKTGRSLCQTAGLAAVVAAALAGLIWVGPHAGAPPAEEPPGSGIVVRTEVTALWVPLALYDLAQQRADSLCDSSEQDLLKICGPRAAWYALTRRGHQVNGRWTEITQIRRASETAGHRDEFRDVIATVAGKPPRYETLDFSHAAIFVIPESLLAVEPLQAIARLRAAPVTQERARTKHRTHPAGRTEFIPPDY